MLLLCFLLQKENTQTVQEELNRLFEEIKRLMGQPHRNEKLGILIHFKPFFTMVDSGLVLKWFQIAPMKCRVCVKTMPQFRKEQLENNISDYIHPGSIEFGPSVCHTKIHVGDVILDWGARERFKQHGKQGFTDDLREGKKRIHDELLKRLGIHVNEPRAGGSGTSNTGEYIYTNLIQLVGNLK